MREYISPFKRHEGDERPTLYLHGVDNNKHTTVDKDKTHIIMEAIAEGWDIDIQYATIEGDLDISTIPAPRPSPATPHVHPKYPIENISITSSRILGTLDFHYTAFNGDALFNDSIFYSGVNFVDSEFKGDNRFINVIFKRHASFGYVTFMHDAGFSSAKFFGKAMFNDTKFYGKAIFNTVTFRSYVNFMDAEFNLGLLIRLPVMKHKASFTNVHIKENTVLRGLCNITFGARIKRLRCIVTDFSGFDTATVMDGASNPYLKRYIDDELWIESWKNRPTKYRLIRWLREFGFFIWELTSHCGRSFTSWMVCSLLIAYFFGAVYSNHDWLSWFPSSWHPEFYISAPDRISTGFTYYYFSIVAFTTLGFGDITPKNLAGEIWLAIEVVLGYIMLGGLLSIFANKFARRS
jgi:hypothetical protein